MENQEKLSNIAAKNYSDALSLLDKSTIPTLRQAIREFRYQVKHGQLIVMIDQFPADMIEGRIPTEQSIAIVDQFPGLPSVFSPKDVILGKFIPIMTINLARLIQDTPTPEKIACIAAELIPAVMLVSKINFGAEMRWKETFQEIFEVQKNFLKSHQIPLNHIYSDPRDSTKEDLLKAIPYRMATHIDVGYGDFLRVIEIRMKEIYAHTQYRRRPDNKLLRYLRAAQNPLYFQALRSRYAMTLSQIPGFSIITGPEEADKTARARDVARQLILIGTEMYENMLP